MSFSLNLDVLTVFEVIGIALAVIGFFNLSTKLDEMFSKMENGFVANADWKIKYARSYWPPHKNIKRMAIEAAKSFPIAGGLYVGTVLLMGWWSIMWHAYLGLALSWQIAAIFSLILAFVLNELFATFIIMRFFAMIAHMFSRIFRLLSIPPSGMTGTLGLLVTITSFVIGRI